MRIKAKDVKPGMRVWSKFLGEYFTVAEVKQNDDIITITDGIYSLKGDAEAVVRVKQ